MIGGICHLECRWLLNIISPYINQHWPTWICVALYSSCLNTNCGCKGGTNRNIIKRSEQNKAKRNTNDWSWITNAHKPDWTTDFHIALWGHIQVWHSTTELYGLWLFLVGKKVFYLPLYSPRHANVDEGLSECESSPKINHSAIGQWIPPLSRYLQVCWQLSSPTGNSGSECLFMILSMILFMIMSIFMFLYTSSSLAFPTSDFRIISWLCSPWSSAPHWHSIPPRASWLHNYITIPNPLWLS